MKKAHRKILNLKEDTLDALENIKKRNLISHQKLKETNYSTGGRRSQRLDTGATQRYLDTFDCTVVDSKEMTNFNTLLSDICDASNSYVCFYSTRNSEGA